MFSGAAFQPSSNPFGTTTAFGAPATQPNTLFGAPAPATPAAGPFGQTSFGQPAAAAPFGQTTTFGQAPPATTAFGAPSTGFGTVATTPAFGAPATAGFGATPSAFGTNTTAFGAQPTAFGTNTTAFGAPATNSPFGTPTASANPFGTTPAFGAAGAAAPFGAPTASAAAPFGAPTASTMFGGTGFGTTAPATPAASSPFGAPTTTPFGATTTNAFGATATTPFGATATTPFGAQTTGSMFGATPGAFGAAPAAAAPSSLFGVAPGLGQQGTRGYVPTTEMDANNKINFNSISAMPQYNTKSFEELRFEDYSIGRKGGQPQAPATPAATGTPFGFPTPGQPANPTPAAATPAPFGQPFGSAFPTQASPFAAAPAPVAAPAFPTATPTTFVPSGSFGTSFANPTVPATPAVASSFGFPAATTPSPFGVTPVAPFGSTFSGSFAQPPPATPAPASSLFGAAPTSFQFNTTPAPAPTNPASPFGAPAATSFASFAPAATTPVTTFPAAQNTFPFQTTPASTASPFGLQPAATANLFTTPTFTAPPGPIGTSTPQPVVTSVNVNPYGTSPMPNFSGLPSYSPVSPAKPPSTTEGLRDFTAQYRFPPHLAPRIKPRTPTPYLRLEPPTQLQPPQITPDMFIPRVNGVKHLVIEPDTPQVQNGNSENMFKPRASHPDPMPSPSRPRQNNNVLPKLTGEGYYTIPSLDALSQMDEIALSQVPNFKVGRFNYGVVEFFGTVDVRGLDLDDIVRFDSRIVTVYQDNGKSTKPARGEGLNKPARIQLLNVVPYDRKTGQPKKDPESLARYKQKIQDQTIKSDATLRSYDPESGEWVFDVRGF